MKLFTRHGWWMIYILAIVSLVVGVIFIWQGTSKYTMIENLAASEKVTTGLTEEQIKNGEVIHSMTQLERAGETVREHRKAIASSYNDVLNGQRFDPTNPKHATYAQAINLENYLFLGTLSMGVSLVLIGVGLFQILVAVALFIIGASIEGNIKKTTI